ncbi:MAG: pyridoxal phosphate-dependent aminotransferase [Alphaproteobacteria bacterium]|nr:pyridoxal phosphate-dependent aminotransferase [Alphaproteobacteria bacterium]
MIKFVPIIEALPATVPFVGPETLERRNGKKMRARLGANENVFGPSPKVITAMTKAASESWQYGDPEHYDLKATIASHHGVSPENIACGEGIDGLLGLAVRLFIEPGDAVATSLGAYPTFNFHVAASGGRLVTAPYVNDHEHPLALIPLAAREKAKLVYIANPDNPMGTVWPAREIKHMIDHVPDGCMMLLDEAYVEFAPAGTAPPMDVNCKNLLRFRTFSKAYGMAGVRIGYCIGHRDVIAAFDKIRNHFGISRMAQAGAIAAIKDQAHLARIIAKVARARTALYDIANANGLKPILSATNFVSMDCGRDQTFARAIVDGLLQKRIFIRMPGIAPLSRCIRISCGTQDNLQVLANALPSVLKSIR